MPNPKDFESEKEFMPVCVAKRQEEHPDEDSEQSVAICASMWEDKFKSDRLAEALRKADDLLKGSANQPRDSHGRWSSGGGGSSGGSSGGSGTSAKPSERLAHVTGKIDSILEAIDGGDNLDAIHHFDLHSIRTEIEAVRNMKLTPKQREVLENAVVDFNALGEQLQYDGAIASFPFVGDKKSHILDEVLLNAKKVLNDKVS